MAANGVANNNFRGMSRSYSLYYKEPISLRTRNLTVLNKSKFEGDVLMKSKLRVTGSLILTSRNILTDAGFQTGEEPEKDMGNNDYTDELNPNSFQNDFFAGMADFVDGNIVAGDKDSGDRLNASFWEDLGGDVFDNWGYFYLYDVASGKYYFPLLTPQNQDDGVITTQVCNAFDRTFTIKHGWTTQGIFKFDITVNDTAPFRFGAYGNMGSDGDEVIEHMTQQYSVSGTSLTLHYLRHSEDGDDEIIYCYFVPKVLSENESRTYQFDNDSEDMSLKTNDVTVGVTIYFGKTNDVKDWVINDLELSSAGVIIEDLPPVTLFEVNEVGNTYVGGSLLSQGPSLGKMTLTTMDDRDYIALADSLINGYFKSEELTDNRSFTIPSAASIVASIPNCKVNTTFRFIINNSQQENYNRNITTVDGSVTLDYSLRNTSVPQWMVCSYLVMITSVEPESESAIVLQDSHSLLL
jgi:hypothetical protein